jgi:hypothetical protein
MHRDHEHRHDDHRHDDAGLGHNRPHEPHGVAQWQAPHLDPHRPHTQPEGEPDLDQVEAAFVEGFMAASDPTSFLRLARVPFEAMAADGARLALLRVEIDAVADVGALTPHLGGASFRYDPLPARLVSKRRRVRFVYSDGRALRPLTFAAVREDLAEADGQAAPIGTRDAAAPERNRGEIRTR